ncbi:MAG: hypothetical protein K0B14_08395 [Anaerolineaceae bacterium]|nr:hypothetical protein [Anaerolineaceae bacterium]
MNLSPLITQDLLDFLKSHYALHWNGLHGFQHWVRVRENGLKLASLNGANQKVVEYFAFTHDIQRQSDGFDPEHGARACKFIREYLIDRIDLTTEEVNLLCLATSGHTNGKCHPDITVSTCWDADRLDLMRAGIRPHPKRLCTPQARDPQIIEWAIQRSVGMSEL